MTDDRDRPVPTDVAGNTRSDVAKRIPQMEQLRRGSNVPSGMDSYLAGYIDAHYQVKDDLDRLESMLRQFDQELRQLRSPTCYMCGSVIEDESVLDDGSPECPECGENPMPPVGGEQP